MIPFIYRPPAGPPNIIYQDEHLLLVDKQAGLLSVPGKGEDRSDCLINRLRMMYPSILLVHRLDQDTSGVMVFALTAHAQRHIGQQFEKRIVEKAYVARVAGQMQADSGLVDQPLIVDWPNRPLQKICHETGRSAQTEWRAISRDSTGTRVALHPITGRSHQLRVHMLHLGHPILGDPLYAPQGEASDYPRLMLHAELLRFRHPEGGEWMNFSAPPSF